MSQNFSGIIDLYDTILSCGSASRSFYEWLKNSKKYVCGQICNAPVWYEKKYRWYMTEDNYLTHDEPNSTWKARKFTTKSEMEKSTSGFVKKYFDIETEEHLLSTHGKFRPVILIHKYTSDWFNPLNSNHHIDSWLCVPILSYKYKRHSQKYILNDQKFNTMHRVYIPPICSNDNPGINDESSAHWNLIQTINENYLEPIKCDNLQQRIKLPFRISESALKIIMFHFTKGSSLFDLFLDSNAKEMKSFYEGFVELVREEIDKKYP